MSLTFNLVFAVNSDAVNSQSHPDTTSLVACTLEIGNWSYDCDGIETVVLIDTVVRVAGMSKFEKRFL